MDTDPLHGRYRELQAYVGWTDDDSLRIAATAPLIDARLPALIEDFYEVIERHPRASKVITGGTAQVERLKGMLLGWIRELLAGQYDKAYVERRWRVGWRHVEIGLDQAYTNTALSRLRTGLCRSLQEEWVGEPDLLMETVRSLNKALDLDLAIIEEAYQAEYALRLQRSERLATLGQIAGGVAHELRNPLNVIKTSVYYLLNARNPTPEKQAEHLGRIERHIGLADGVISALASFTKMPTPHLESTQVEPCVIEALEIAPLGDGISLEMDLPPHLPPVMADAGQLRIALGNLIRNARDAMPRGGTLTISGRAAEGGVEIAIADTGVGILASDIPRIMEPFFSTKERGLGFGLSIARTIIDRSRGSLRVESEPGRGSTFTLGLMAATDGQDASEPPEGPSRESSESKPGRPEIASPDAKTRREDGRP